MNVGYLSNTVAIATTAQFFLKLTANLIGKICCYAPHMNESSLNDSENFQFFNTFEMYVTQHSAGCCKVPFVSWRPI